jgi:hypothetical protein
MSVGREIWRSLASLAVVVAVSVAGIALLSAGILAWLLFQQSAAERKWEAEARDKVIQHAFWRVPMDGKRVDEMADTILGLDEDSVFFVGEDGELFVETDPARCKRANSCCGRMPPDVWPQRFKGQRFIAVKVWMWDRGERRFVFESLDEHLRNEVYERAVWATGSNEKAQAYIE